MTNKRDIRNPKVLIFISLIIIGLTINFLPTLQYYTMVYPRLNGSFDQPGLRLRYFLQLMVAHYNVSEEELSKVLETRPVSNITRRLIVIMHVNGTLNIIRNSSGIFYRFTGICNVNSPFFPSVKSIRLRSEGALDERWIITKMLRIDNISNVVLLGRIISLKEVPPTIISFKALLRPSFYLKPVIYFNSSYGNVAYKDQVVNYINALSYLRLEKGGYLLYWLNVERDYRGRNPRLVGAEKEFLNEIERIVFDNNILEKISEESGDRVLNFYVNMGLEDANVKVVNDIIGRIMFDTTFTYFPINLVIILAGLIGLILYKRRRI